MKSYKDQLNREILLGKTPKRIVSTVPSQTELICDLGLENEIVGITAYCVHPNSLLKEKSVIGGTKNLNIELIKSLEPDLIIANKEENIKEQIDELALYFPVWISDCETLGEGISMIESIGKILNKEQESLSLISKIKENLKALSPLANFSVLYFIWKEPYMVSGNETYIGNVLEVMGLNNSSPISEARYPQLSLEDITDKAPQILLLSSEPYSYSTKEAHELASKLPNTIVKIVDGEMFTWYGSRMEPALRYFNKLISEIELISSSKFI